MTIVRELRQEHGLDPKVIAEASGLSIAEYYDLESYHDELHVAASVESIARVARALGVAPSRFYGGSSENIISVAELASLVSRYLVKSNRSLGELEDEVGWDLAESLKNPSRFLSFNADGLRDVCTAIGVNWLNVLDGVAAE